MHNFQVDPASGEVYLFTGGASEIMAFDPASPTGYVTYPTTQGYRGILVDPAGGGLLGLRNLPAPSAFEHLAIPSGALTASSTSTAGLPDDGVFDLVNVDFD